MDAGTGSPENELPIVTGVKRAVHEAVPDASSVALKTTKTGTEKTDVSIVRERGKISAERIVGGVVSVYPVCWKASGGEGRSEVRLSVDVTVVKFVVEFAARVVELVTHVSKNAV